MGSAPISVVTDPVFETGVASSYLPAFHKLAARVGLAPTPCGLTNRRATLTPSGNGAADRILTCIVPLRRRMPDVFDHGSNSKWSERRDLDFPSLASQVPTRDIRFAHCNHLRPRGPKVLAHGHKRSGD